jgi:heme exporter protein B
MRSLQAVLARDLTIALRRKGDALTALFFFVIVVSLFPMAVGADPALLRTLGPGVLWVAALLSSILGLHRLFADDHADGTLEQLALSPRAFPVLVAGKILAHWLVTGLPLVLLAPLLALEFGLGTEAMPAIVGGLLLGTPLLSLLGAIGAALALGLRGAGALLPLLVLPLYVPALVFGAGAVQASEAGLDPRAHLALLAAMLVVAAFFVPFAVAGALRIAIE